jgi:hypothetical protein
MNGRILKMTLLLVGCSIFSGCVTKQLWQDSAFNEPCPNPNLHLYYSESKRDVLAVYDELHEPSSLAHTKAYYVFKSAMRSNPNKPAFVDARKTNGLVLIPITSTNAIALGVKTNRFARVEANGSTFTLYLNGEERGPFDLPVYPSGFHRATQVALTPVAVAADTAIVGTVVGAYWAYAWAGSNNH